ncbi:AraC family transcriptional regulator [Marinobacterium sp. D7]|uniref:AraC family transcriptional regulator n=1 Tax=Marinobacterium ramblicola TaxID=2849041 RepID=UPI001C2CE646|nr:AraC family transcriptional regulator [Marinobacterium ramblicola]
MNEQENRYEQRFDRVLDYIEQHLDEALSVEHLSQVANFSRFHFHRQFAAYTGVNVARYVQLLRLKRASYRLAFEPSLPVTEIALDAGFENPESFSRAFKKAFGQTPSQFRRSPAWHSWTERYQFQKRERRRDMDVDIIDFEETRVAVLEHRGSPVLVNDSVKVFIDWRKSTGLSPVASSDSFGIAYDDPNTTEPEQFRFDLCGEVAEPIPENPQGLINKVIPAGRCARLRHVGPHMGLGECAYYLYRQWLPESGEELRDFPLFFLYHNLITDTPEHELVTDLLLPLK